MIVTQTLIFLCLVIMGMVWFSLDLNPREKGLLF